MSNSLRPHGLWHTRLPSPSLSPRVCWDSYPLSQWCYPSIPSSVVPFSSCPQSFQASGSFPVSQLFTSGGQTLELQLQHQFFQRIFKNDFLYDWSPCSPRDSQESSPESRFESIYSLALSLSTITYHFTFTMNRNGCNNNLNKTQKTTSVDE